MHIIIFYVIFFIATKLKTKTIFSCASVWSPTLQTCQKDEYRSGLCKRLSVTNTALLLTFPLNWIHQTSSY